MFIAHPAAKLRPKCEHHRKGWQDTLRSPASVAFKLDLGTPVFYSLLNPVCFLHELVFEICEQ